MAENRRPSATRDRDPPGDPRSGTAGPTPIAFSQFTEIARPLTMETEVAPRSVARGIVVFDMDGTIIDSIGRIALVAADVMATAFGTPNDEARIHYLATTGMPFEAQLAQLYPEAPAPVRAEVARLFHTRKVREAYAQAKPFPEVPKMLKRLSSDGWTLVVSTGAEREMADLLLEREGLRFWFEDVLGSGQGTKREHLLEYGRRFPGAPRFLVGDSRFDMEAAASTPGVVALARASTLEGWSLTPDDLKRWGAAWADYSLAGVPDALNALTRTTKGPPGRRPAARGRKGRDRESPKSGVGPASV